MTKLTLSLCALMLFLLACNNAAEEKTETEVKNTILLIGDGMGVNQVFAAYSVNNNKLNMFKATATGFSKTQSANQYITDSGAGGTAIATGQKTNNQMIGVNPMGQPLTSLLELSEKKGLATGLIATSSITHATPASFIAHHKNRKHEYAIAKDFVPSGIDVFIGGGRTFFEDSTENISEILRNKGYSIVYDLADIDTTSTTKIGCLAAEEALPSMLDGRGDYLEKATQKALARLSKNKNGFFIMIEGSQIDWGGHANDRDYVLSELLDFDKVVGEAMHFADENPGTLVVVTADHETGGFSILEHNSTQRNITTHFSTTDHTPTMVPVFAYGTGAEKFSGVYENTEIFKKIVELMSLEN